MDTDSFLENAHRIWTVNGSRIREPLFSSNIQVARVAPGEGRNGSRRLTDLERIELEQHISRYDGGSNRRLFLVVAVMAAMVVAFVLLSHLGGIPHLAFALVPVAAQVALVKKGRPFVSGLEEDLEKGELVPDKSSGSLKLPVSGMPWSVYGTPSAWRTVAPPLHVFSVPKREDFI